MAANLTIESPDFDRIRKGDFRATENAIRLLWFMANDEARTRRAQDRLISDRLSPKVLSKAPSGNENNVDLEGAGVVAYTGSTAVNITGYRAPGADGDVLLIIVTGSGTITHMHQSASSDAGNRMVINGAVDQAVATNESLLLVYNNARWREMKWA